MRSPSTPASSPDAQPQPPYHERAEQVESAGDAPNKLCSAHEYMSRATIGGMDKQQYNQADRGRKRFQFGLRSLLIVTTVVAIAATAIIPVQSYMQRRDEQRKLDEYYSFVRPQLYQNTNNAQPADSGQ